VIFAHGQESGPWGFKIKRMAPLAELHGCQVESIDYRDCKDPELRVERLLLRLQDEDAECILVGSSMGGWIMLLLALASGVSEDARRRFVERRALRFDEQSQGKGLDVELIPPELAEEAALARRELLEALADVDDAFAEVFLEREDDDVPVEAIHAALRTATAELLPFRRTLHIRSGLRGQQVEDAIAGADLEAQTLPGGHRRLLAEPAHLFPAAPAGPVPLRAAFFLRGFAKQPGLEPHRPHQ